MDLTLTTPMNPAKPRRLRTPSADTDFEQSSFRGLPRLLEPLRIEAEAHRRSLTSLLWEVFNEFLDTKDHALLRSIREKQRGEKSDSFVYLRKPTSFRTDRETLEKLRKRADFYRVGLSDLINIAIEYWLMRQETERKGQAR